MAIDGILNKRCSISGKAIASLITKATKEGRQFALAIITDPDGSRHYFDALLLNQWFLKEPKVTNPNTRSTTFTVQYLWNKTRTDVFEPLGELPAFELTLENKKFSEMNRYAVACNHVKGIKRIKSIGKILLDNPVKNKDWISALYSNFSHQLSLQEVFADVCSDFGAELVECDGENDHVHLLVNYPPKVAVSKLVNSLKGVSSRLIRKKNYPSIRNALWGESLWSPSYFSGTCGGAPLAIVKEYIQSQSSPNH